MSILKKGTKVTLLTSYCHDNDVCTDDKPCLECIQMCNTFELLIDVHAVYLHQVGDSINHTQNSDNDSKNIKHDDCFIKINGKNFKCRCGCNVFHKPYIDEPHIYQCNVCDTQYEGG